MIRYDARGNGLSDWDVGDVTLDSFVADLEAVVEAQGLHRFNLFGVSQGCAVSIAYAVKHGLPGAADAYARLTSAANWIGFRAALDAEPVWSVAPGVFVR